MFVCVSACLIIMLNTLLVIVLRRHQRQGGAVAKATFTHVSWMQTTNVRPKQTKRFVCRLFILLSGQLLKHSCSIQHLFVRSHSVGSFVPPSVSHFATGMFWIAKLGQGVWPKYTQHFFFPVRTFCAYQSVFAYSFGPDSVLISLAFVTISNWLCLLNREKQTSRKLVMVQKVITEYVCMINTIWHSPRTNWCRLKHKRV